MKTLEGIQLGCRGEMLASLRTRTVLKEPTLLRINIAMYCT